MRVKSIYPDVAHFVERYTISSREIWSMATRVTQNQSTYYDTACGRGRANEQLTLTLTLTLTQVLRHRLRLGARQRAAVVGLAGAATRDAGLEGSVADPLRHDRRLPLARVGAAAALHHSPSDGLSLVRLRAGAPQL